ncbi:MAG: hypothetical protein ACE5JP_11605 [Candidatus Bipolaricaulia bacterium]
MVDSGLSKAVIRFVAGLLSLLILLIAPAVHVYPWGPKAHQAVTRYAVENLPAPLQGFFAVHRDFLVEHALDPDRRKGEDGVEAPKHYIDIDYYDSYPFAHVSRDLAALIAKYGEQTVYRIGILPWAIAVTVDELTEAMRAGDIKMLLNKAADLSHYVADANQPLHTTQNHDGQQTGNFGIHARFETAFVDFFWKDGYFVPQPAWYVDDPLEYAFGIIAESHRLLDPVLRADTKAAARYSLAEWGYYQTLWEEGAGDAMQGAFNQAAADIASLWYTAWVDAGRPEL